jgi:hypothetical protein
MQTLQLQLEDDIFQDLRQQATLQATSVENLARKALANYLHLGIPESTTANKYSFIGIGRSGKGNLSTQICLGDLAIKLFGKENGVELELAKYPLHNPLKLDEL